MNKRYRVRLSGEEREHLEKLVRKGKAHARKLTYARILLKSDENGPAWTDEQIAEAFEVSVATVARERRRFCEEGLEVALLPKKPGRPRRHILDGRTEAHLIALACSNPPEGRDHWPLRLSADQMVELGYVESLSYETVRRTLKKQAQASPEEAVGDPAHQEERRFRVEDGGGFGSLRRSLRSQKTDDLLRRAAIPDALRRERSPADETWPTRACQLRIRARRQCLRTHGFRTA